jgi:hypothetical protein
MTCKCIGFTHNIGGHLFVAKYYGMHRVIMKIKKTPHINIALRMLIDDPL